MAAISAWRILIVSISSGSENATAEFTGYVASFSMETPAEDIVTATVELAIDGGVTFDLATA